MAEPPVEERVQGVPLVVQKQVKPAETKHYEGALERYGNIGNIDISGQDQSQQDEYGAPVDAEKSQQHEGKKGQRGEMGTAG